MPDWASYVRQNLRLRTLRPEREAEIVEDLAGQLEYAYRESLNRGLTDEQAQDEARQHVVDWASLANELDHSHRGKVSAMAILQRQAEDRDVRKRRTFSILSDLRQDVLYGLRVLAKNRGFTTIAVLTLALGIGANTAIFSIIDAVMLKSLPVRDPQGLMLLKWGARQSPKFHNSNSYGDCVTSIGGANASGCSLSKPFLEDVRTKTNVFSGLGEFAGAGAMNLSGNGPASRVNAQYVSGDFFQTLGVSAAAGRLIEPFDDTPSANSVAVLNYAYWQKAFGGNSSVVGETIHLNNLPFTIVGVAEARFNYLTPGNGYDLWIPLSQRSRLRKGWNPRSDDAGSWWIVAVGRLKPGVARSEAQNKLSQLFLNDLPHGDKPLAKEEDAPAITLEPAQTGLTGARRRLSTPLYVLMMAVGIVLLIACANVAGLMLARAAARQKEIAVRLALGAGRARIVRQLLTESVTLSVAGGLLGIILAFWGARSLLAFLASTSQRPLGFTAALDFRVLGFTAAAAIITGIAFGLAPAVRCMRVDLTPVLKEGAGKGSSEGHGGRGWLNLGNSLVVAQVALTVVVLVGAGLLVKTLENLKSIDPGFSTNNVLNFDVDPTLTGYKGERLATFYRDLRDRFNAIPGVLSASYSEMSLLSGSLSTTGFHLPGTPPKRQSDADYLPVGAEFFATMRIPLVGGRVFHPEEYVQAAKEEADPKSQSQMPEAAIVNESFVRAYFPNVNPLGQPFGANGPGITGEPDQTVEPGWVIVGVVGDAKYNNLRREVHPTMYVPSEEGGSFELRTGGNPMAAMDGIRDVIRQTGSDIPIFNIKTESDQIDALLFQERMIARLSSSFGMLALLLACIGLYGLLSYEVAGRTREIGIRMALGAQAGNVLRDVVWKGIKLAATGVAIGTAASFEVTRYLGTVLYDVKPSDPTTLVSVGVILLLVTLAACYVPARRATTVDPLVALRYE